MCFSADELTPATPSEVEAHLVEIANAKGFVLGAKYKWSDKEAIKDEVRTVDNELLYDAERNILTHNNWVIWESINGWATIVNEVEQERWKPHKNEIYWCVDLSAENGILDYVNTNDEIDKLFYTTHNCFKTEKEAQKKANQIKELLSKK